MAPRLIQISQLSRSTLASRRRLGRHDPPGVRRCSRTPSAASTTSPAPPSEPSVAVWRTRSGPRRRRLFWSVPIRARRDRGALAPSPAVELGRPTGGDPDRRPEPPRLSRLPALDGLAEPLLEAGLAEAGVAVGDEAARAELGTVVARAGVGDHLAPVVARAQGPSDDLVEAEPLGPGDLDRAVERRAQGGPADRVRDVVGRHGLEGHRRRADNVPLGGRVGDAREELEELGRGRSSTGSGTP